ALLRTVALGWRHEDIADKAREVQRLGSELYSRLNTVGDDYNRVGRSLERAVEALNSTLSSTDSRGMVNARRLSVVDIPTRTDERPTDLAPVTAAPVKASSNTTRDITQPRHAADPAFGDGEGGTDLFGMNSAGS